MRPLARPARASTASALCALLAALAFSGAAQAGRDPPSHQRLPLQSDFDRCALAAADHGNESLQGRVRLELLIRKSGNVYASFVHSESGVEDRTLERCLTSGAVLWMLPPVAVDYQRAYELFFVSGGTEIDFSNGTYWDGRHFAGQGRASVFMPDINEPPKPARLNTKAAQATLEIADWATDAERGVAELAVLNYAEALAALRSALVKDPNDTVALRALAQALAESGGDLGEARAAAELLTTLAPGSAASHEALLRVCLVAGDDPCAYQEFQAARTSTDLEPRSRLLADLQPSTERAAVRLREAAALAHKLDPCASVSDDGALALCLVRRCLDDGTAAYAGEQHAHAGAWKLSPGGDGKLIATRPLGLHAEDADPRWLVKVYARSVRMTPVNPAARHVTLRHNRCGVLDSPRRDDDGTFEQPIVRNAAPTGKSNP